MDHRPESPSDAIRAVYRVRCEPAAIDAAARDIALEQTVEVPAPLAEAIPAAAELVGRVASIERADDAFDVTIDYCTELAAGQVPQLLNLIYGNISLKPGIRLIDLRLPDTLLATLPGPTLGIAGLRRVLGVHGRPLLATALKPRGSTDSRLAGIAEAFARGGGDIVKDDHNLVDDSLDAFKRRIDACQSAVERADAATGRRCIYAPNVCAPLDALDDHLAAVAARGIAAVLVSPLVVGLDAVRVAADRYRLAVLAHPTFAGTFFHDPAHGIEPGVLLGTLFRLAGADASIFPNFGGRFTFTRGDCTSIADRLREPMKGVAAAWPAPAGGMKFDNVPDMAEQYGADAIFLVGGALLADDRPLERATAALLDALREPFDETLTEPEAAPVSACELPGERAAPLAHLPFNADFSWQGRPASAYKSAAQQSELPFKDVARHELIGMHGERTAFDLRYFEIAPGGYTSCERHHHTHTIVAVRGRGSIVIDGEPRALAPFDIAYVDAMQVHQLRNDAPATTATSATSEPFGFFCIVDHDRDRPMPPD